MSMKYIMQAMGDGNIQSSPIFKSAFDWIFYHAVLVGNTVVADDSDDLSAAPISTHLAPPFDLSKYTLLHDFMVNESVLLTEPVGDAFEDRVQQVSYGYSEAMADQLAHTVWLWIKGLDGLTGAEQEALRQMAQVITTGVLYELFQLPLKGGVFEAEFAKRCITPETESRFQQTFGSRQALKWFPRSSERGKWLENDLGM